MYVVVHHTILDAPEAAARGVQLMKNEGSREGTKVLQFYPAVDGSTITCLWEAHTVDDIQWFVDTVLGETSSNRCYEVNADIAFARQPLGLPENASVPA